MKELILGLGLLALKSSLLLLFAELVAGRTRRAAMRHFVWLLAVLALAALPLLQIALPALRFSVPGVSEQAAGVSPVIRTLTEGGSREASPPPAPAGRANTTTMAPTSGYQAGSATWIRSVQRAVLIVYAAGVVFMTLQLLLGHARLRRRAIAGISAPGPVRGIADDIRRHMGMNRYVDVVTSHACPVPHLVGLLYPVVVLPAGAFAWPEERLRHVLAHEMAHCHRADVASGILGALVRIIYWPHPWVARAVRNMHQAAEHACDDAVLRGGATARAYARDLVLLARAGRMDGPIPAPAMSSRSFLPRRVDALLDASRDRRPLRHRAGWIGVLLLIAAAAPLGAARPGWGDSPPALHGGDVRARIHHPVQARWFDSESHTAVFAQGPLLLSEGADAGTPGFLLLLSLRAGAPLRTMQILSRPGKPARFMVGQAGALESWSGPGTPWIDQGLATAAARLPETAGIVWPRWVVPEHGHYGGSTITGLPGISQDTSRNLVQAGWQDQRYRLGVFSTGRLARPQPGSLPLPAKGEWLVVFRFDTVSGRLQVAECRRDNADVLKVIYTDDGQNRQQNTPSMPWFRKILSDLPPDVFGPSTVGVDS